MTKEQVKNLRADMEAFFKSIEAKYGVNISVGSIAYRDDGFKTSIEGISAELGDKYSRNFLQTYARYPGYTRDMLGQVYEIEGDLYKFRGWKFGVKYSMIFEAPGGSLVAFTEASVKPLMISQYKGE